MIVSSLLGVQINSLLLMSSIDYRVETIFAKVHPAAR